MELSSSLYVTGIRDAVKSMVVTIAQLPAYDGVDEGVPPNGIVPAEIVRNLAHLRLLEGVPFSYLVPDANLLPPESIRFFYIDRNATDALTQGALSVGTVNASDQLELAALYATVRDEVDEAERLVRINPADIPKVDATGRPIGTAAPISGFLLRSKLVSGWPGLHVRAFSTDNNPDDKIIDDNTPDPNDNPIRLLRMERLAPAVLLVLFDGVPMVVHIEEPRSGIQFGVRLAPTADPTQQDAVLTLRDVKHPNAGPLQSGGHDQTVPVPFRPGSPGVIHMKHLNDALLGVAATNMDGSVDSAEFAMQMLRFPLRQVFGNPKVAPTANAFVPTVKMVDLEARFQLAARVLEH
jgi:hypothetical protein